MKQRSLIFLVFFTVFLDLLGFGILIPILPYIALDFDATPMQIGWLMAVYSIMQFLFAPLWGRLSDRFGRRPILLISLLGSTTGYIIFAFSTTLTGLFLSRILAGIAAANISTAQAVMADILPKEKRTFGMGMVGAAIGFGFALGPGLSALTVSDTNYMLPILLAAGMSGLDLILVFFLLPETHKKGIEHPAASRFSLRVLKEAATVKMIPVMLSVSLLYYIAFAAMESTYALFGEAIFDLKAWQNGVILMSIGVLMAIVQGGLVGRVTLKFGEVPTFLTGLTGVIIGLAFIGFAQSFTAFVTWTLVMGVSAGFVTPVVSSMISQLSHEDVQGSVLGLNQSMASLGRIFGPLSGTFFFDAFGPRSPFWFGALVVSIVLLLGIYIFTQLGTRVAAAQTE